MAVIIRRIYIYNLIKYVNSYTYIYTKIIHKKKTNHNKSRYDKKILFIFEINLLCAGSYDEVAGAKNVDI